MKVIVAGSRDITDAFLVRRAIEKSGFVITELVSGGARGVDKLGELYAQRNKIPIKQFIPDWSIGRGAGHIRNHAMADYVGTEGGLVAIWDGKSKGTKGMIDYATRKGLKVYIHLLDQQTDGANTT